MKDKLVYAKVVSIGGIINIESPNDWLKKAGAHVENGKLILPHDFLMMPMQIASKAVVAFQNNTDYENRVESAFLISLCVRSIEDAFFRKIAEFLNSRNKIQTCRNCIRNYLFDTDIKKFRGLCNEKIIHGLERSQMINPDDLDYAVKYYEELFKLPLMDPIKWDAKKNIPLCKKCLEINKARKSIKPTSTDR